MADALKNPELEILVATMNRNSLDFLFSMFSEADLLNHHVLIINQTSPDNLLVSDYPNIRVINTYEKGLSNSRNLALQNAIGKIVLIADDDVKYLPGFQQQIINSYTQNPDVNAICFQTVTAENKLFRSYKSQKTAMKNKDFLWVLSIEITCKLAAIKENAILFNEHFGLGARFQDSESLYFLRRLHHNNLKVLFVPQNIVLHESRSSSDDITSDRWLYAKTAGFYKCYQLLAYLLAFKMVFFLLRKNKITFYGIQHKLQVAFSGIKDYKALLQNKSEEFFK